MSKIVYNVTVKVDPEVLDDWLDWMKNIHIPDVMATGKFLEYRLQRIINAQEGDNPTYAIQYLCADMATLHQYQIHHAAALQQDHTERYKDRFVAFRTLMEVLDHS